MVARRSGRRSAGRRRRLFLEQQPNRRGAGQGPVGHDVDVERRGRNARRRRHRRLGRCRSGSRGSGGAAGASSSGGAAGASSSGGRAGQAGQAGNVGSAEFSGWRRLRRGRERHGRLHRYRWLHRARDRRLGLLRRRRGELRDVALLRFVFVLQHRDQPYLRIGLPELSSTETVARISSSNRIAGRNPDRWSRLGIASTHWSRLEDRCRRPGPRRRRCTSPGIPASIGTRRCGGHRSRSRRLSCRRRHWASPDSRLDSAHSRSWCPRWDCMRCWEGRTPRPRTSRRCR